MRKKKYLITIKEIEKPETPDEEEIFKQIIETGDYKDITHIIKKINE